MDGRRSVASRSSERDDACVSMEIPTCRIAFQVSFFQTKKLRFNYCYLIPRTRSNSRSHSNKFGILLIFTQSNSYRLRVIISIGYFSFVLSLLDFRISLESNESRMIVKDSVLSRSVAFAETLVERWVFDQRIVISNLRIEAHERSGGTRAGSSALIGGSAARAKENAERARSEDAERLSRLSRRMPRYLCHWPSIRFPLVRRPP